MTILSARALAKAYGPQTLLTDVALTVSEGDRVGLLGVNGTGKSTLLRILAGTEPADTGTIDRRREARILYLPQEPEMPAEATARAVVESGLVEWHAAKSRHAEISHAIDGGEHSEEAMTEQARLAEEVERLGGWDRDHLVDTMLDKLGVRALDQPVGTLSGGERRRVALARILVAAPALAILDEPFRGLDRRKRSALLARARAWWRTSTLLCVTHDVGETLAFERVLVVDGGHVVEDGAPAALAAREGSRYRALLDAEEEVRRGLWSGPGWRRLRLDDGRLAEGEPGPGDAA